MPRSPRLVLPGVPVHVTQRGNNRAATFRCVADFEHYRETLFEASQRFRCAIHSYVLMTNHVHLLMTPEDDRGPSHVMQAIGRQFVRWISARHHRTGTMWQGRFKSSLIDSERYLFACSCYIELNPVRARMVDDPDEYRWSSYRHNARGERDPLITPHPLYHGLGSTPADRQSAYNTLFLQPIEPQTIDRIRRATNRGAVLGDAEFVDRIKPTMDHPTSGSEQLF